MMSVLDPAVPAGAFDEFLLTAAPASAAQRGWTPDDGPLPALYLSHGAPPLFNDAVWMRQLFAWAQSMPKPKAILIVSAHWESAPLSLSSSQAQVTPVYDFGGFAPRYFSMRYDTPDAADLARRVLSVLPDTHTVHQHQGRGLDHGAWVPLKVMYPLLLAMFLVAASVALRAWALARPEALPASSARLTRGSGILLVAIAAMVALGLHLPSLIDALSNQPVGAAYLDAPTLFWVVKFYDLGIVVLAALTVGIGLLRGQSWARKPAYAILGAYVLIGWSVAGMGWSMLLDGDPDASITTVIAVTAIAGAGAAFAYLLYRPLFAVTAHAGRPGDGLR